LLNRQLALESLQRRRLSIQVNWQAGVTSSRFMIAAEAAAQLLLCLLEHSEVLAIGELLRSTESLSNLCHTLEHCLRWHCTFLCG
jgi:hypothetical protein